MKKYNSISVFILLATLAIMVFPHLSVRAQDVQPALDPKWGSASANALSDEINRIAEDIQEKVLASRDYRAKHEHAWNNPAFTSPAVEEKRKALRDAESAAIKARIDLQQEVETLPEVKQLVDDLEKNETTIQALRAYNTELIKLFRAKPSAGTANRK